MKAARPAHTTDRAPASFPFHFLLRPAARRHRLRRVLWAPFYCLLVGCAAEGPPQPPRVERPEPIHDLRARQVGRNFEIRLTLPTLATDGQRLTKPVEVDLFRTETPPRRAPQPPLTAGKPWVELSPTNLARYARGSRLDYSFTLSRTQFRQQLGFSLAFLAVSLTRGFRGRPRRSLPSNLVVVPILDVTEPVENLSVKGTPKVLVLRWSAPRLALSGSPAPSNLTYRIYARSGGRASSFQRLNSTSSTEFQDRDFQFGLNYYFMVRTITAKGNTVAESKDSNVVEITPADIFPPLPPKHLSALYVSPAVELIWQANTETNLAGYRVYRRENHQPFSLLNKKLLRTPVYRDTTVKANRRYIYAATTVDQSGNESGKSSAVTIETR